MSKKNKGDFVVQGGWTGERKIGSKQEGATKVFLTPHMSAEKALWFMHTEKLTALGTGPRCLFVFQEASDAELLYVYEIVDHAYTILGSIAPIQVIQPVARKAVATEAVPEVTLPNLLTVLDPAGDAGYCFGAVVAPTTGASGLLSSKCATEAAVHSTGSDQRRADHLCLC